MIDEKDIEIAKLRGQVEALEKMIKTLAALQPAFPVVLPQVIPTVPQRQPWDPGYPFWTGGSTKQFGSFELPYPITTQINS